MTFRGIWTLWRSCRAPAAHSCFPPLKRTSRSRASHARLGRGARARAQTAPCRRNRQSPAAGSTRSSLLVRTTRSSAVAAGGDATPLLPCRSERLERRVAAPARDDLHERCGTNADSRIRCRKEGVWRGATRAAPARPRRARQGRGFGRPLIAHCRRVRGDACLPARPLCCDPARPGRAAGGWAR